MVKWTESLLGKIRINLNPLKSVVVDVVFERGHETVVSKVLD